jgi:hypothetical protein
MDGKQMTGLMTFLARYYFNIDEYTLSQFILMALMAVTVFFKIAKLSLMQVQEYIASAINSSTKFLTEHSVNLALVRRTNG